MKNKSTIRECEGCKYQNLILDDGLEEKKCKQCGGLLNVIGEEKLK